MQHTTPETTHHAGPPVPWAMLRAAGIVVAQPQGSYWAWTLAELPDEWFGTFATPLDAVQDALTILVAFGIEGMCDDTLPFGDPHERERGEALATVPLPPSARDPHRWNNLVAGDIVEIEGLFGHWLVLALGRSDTNRIVVQDTQIPQLTFDAVASKCHRVFFQQSTSVRSA